MPELARGIAWLVGIAMAAASARSAATEPAAKTGRDGKLHAVQCDEGISAARRGVAAPSGASAAPAQAAQHAPAPDGMVWIPGGEFAMGSEVFPDAQPVHRVAVDEIGRAHV